MLGQTMLDEKKNLENFLSVHARMHLACTGNISSGPQSIILKIAWNDLSICILTGLGSTFWVTEKSGQKWFHGSVWWGCSAASEDGGGQNGDGCDHDNC